MADQPQSRDAASDTNQLFARPALPGQHPEHSNRILDHLRRECGPRDFVEELWLADVAWLTARIDYLRSAIAGMYRVELRRVRDLHEGAEQAWFSPDEIETLTTIEQADHARDDGAAAAEDTVFQRLLGAVTLRKLDTVGKLAVLEQLLGRERDRVLAQFERRRRERVRHALDTVAIEAPVGR